MNSLKRNLDGLLLVDKPQDWTSHDVCDFVRKRFHLRKVGHAGTLDPLATGLLVVLLGKATKLSILMSGCEKEYEGKMELGIETDSHDRHGKTLNTRDPSLITLEMIRQKAESFRGEIIQVPPMVSALKHQGVRLYELARKGITIEREGRPVVVDRFDIQEKQGPLVSFAATVSKGTYVRTLVNDLGQALGCYATLSELRRVRSGKLCVKDAVTIDAMRQFDLPQLEKITVPLSAAPLYADSKKS